MEISEIKQHLSIIKVLDHYGLKPDKHNMLCCPFHQDKTPSFVIYPKTNTFHCFGCGVNGDVIEFIQLKENMGKHEAIMKAESFINPPDKTKPNNKPKPAEPESPEEPKEKNLTELFEEFKQSLTSNRKAQEYLKSRNLNAVSLEIGYNPGKNYDKLKHCIVFPLKDKQDRIVSLYGRSIINNDESKHFYTKDRQGLYPGYPRTGWV